MRAKMSTVRNAQSRELALTVRDAARCLPRALPVLAGAFILACAAYAVSAASGAVRSALDSGKAHAQETAEIGRGN